MIYGKQTLSTLDMPLIAILAMRAQYTFVTRRYNEVLSSLSRDNNLLKKLKEEREQLSQYFN